MSRSYSAADAFVDTSSTLKSTNINKNTENNKHYSEHTKDKQESFGQEIAKVTRCLPDCKDCTGFYTDITEKYLLVCVCPCHNRITSAKLVEAEANG